MIQLRRGQPGLNFKSNVPIWYPIPFIFTIHSNNKEWSHTLHTAGKIEILIFYCWVFQSASLLGTLSKQVTDTCDVSACRTDQRINRASKFPTWWDGAAIPGDWWVENKVPPSTFVKYNSYCIYFAMLITSLLIPLATKSS